MREGVVKRDNTQEGKRAQEALKDETMDRERSIARQKQSKKTWSVNLRFTLGPTKAGSALLASPMWSFEADFRGRGPRF